MLGSWKVPSQWMDSFAGVVHADDTVRAQVVEYLPEQTWMHTLLSRLWTEHRIPGLINTSFNRQGEPILSDSTRAKDVAVQLGLDAVVIDGVLDVF